MFFSSLTVDTRSDPRPHTHHRDDEDEQITICCRETSTISLLDLPSSVVSEASEESEEQRQRNRHYIELCQTKPGNEKFVEREMQTLGDALKNKLIQTDSLDTVESDAVVSSWQIYDSRSSPTDRDLQLREGVIRTTAQNTDTDPESPQILRYVGEGPKLQLNTLLHMERSLVFNIYQQQLASYKHTVRLVKENSETGVREQEEQEEEGRAVSVEWRQAPALIWLWSFRCEITEGCVVTSLAWNKEKTDVLAVGYDCSARDQNRTGLICVWSLKNITWPQRVISCHSSVTSLDFSPLVSSQLGVGLKDGSVSLFNTCTGRRVAFSLLPWQKQVLQLCWTKQGLVSVSVNGLIQNWLLGTKGLETSELFQLRKGTGKQMKKTSRREKDSATAGLCLHFHPTDPTVYLTGSSEGLIHMCSLSNRYFPLDTYTKHFCQVNSVAWSPFSPNLFLSASSDWTVQLWRRDRPSPLMAFSRSSAVHEVHWSPTWPTVFAVLQKETLEIWDLSRSLVVPAVVLTSEASPLTSVRFSPDSGAVVMGDAAGHVRVYQLVHVGVDNSGRSSTWNKFFLLKC
ncbi:unnamed protein product [Knipowitschia caucasica]